ncbi:thiol reductant ABC exporter subunit CydD [Alicyclobacillus sp. ALC3]|uniref:thiol reductant ABC exporter subunit CydD n=1 Tax=Alicyclobacillus sp. ALC3 TaxID=2796143 RepID=UPI002379D4CC|nr:thiol reductant ABC exporter subunit CydD [Alicyclobacillus sp. ALC3]WDL95935.1 thiol reductant ABC exporter subunit CydD [Alicyclobacillus sp. ALC3]
MNRRLLSEIKWVRRLLVVTVGLGLAAGLLIIVQAVFLTHIVDSVFLRKSSLTQVWPSLQMLLGAIALRAAFGWFSEVIALRVAIRVKAQLRMQLLAHLFRLGPAFVHREQSGELVNTAFEGVEQLEPYLARYLPQVSLSALIPLAILVVVFTRDWVSGVIMVVTAPVIVLFMILIGKTAQSAADKQWRAMSILSGHFFDVLRGLTTLKLFNRSRFQADVIQRMSEDYRTTTMGTLRVAFLSSFVLELMATLGTAMMAVAIGLRLLSGHMTFADGFVILLLAPEFYAPIRAIGTQYHASVSGVTAAERILDILSTKPAGLEDNPDGERPDLKQADLAQVEFRDVSFAYERERPAVRHVNFSIALGEKVAIVGATGSGKSTLIHLLLGFLRPDSGAITVAGVPLGEMDVKWWREQVSYVPQTAQLFRGTVADNLRIAKSDASLQDLQTACKLASVDEFINGLPSGYETSVGDMGVGLSGGQMQRLALARAFLKDSGILILDEPTAHLDVVNESTVEAVLDQLLGARTTFIVAHRLSTIYHADRILVLDNGAIVGEGRHHELWQNNPHYRKLLRAYQGRASRDDTVGPDRDVRTDRRNAK